MPATTHYAYATPESEIGLAIEATKGVAATPKFWVPVKSPKYKVDQTEIPDETLQGSMVKIYNEVPGLRYDSHGWDSYPYLDSFPLLAHAELGSPDTMIAASATTTLATAGVVGTTSVKMTAKPTVGTFVAIGATGTVESHKVLTVTGTVAPFTVTLATPLIFAQPTGAPVKGLTGHKYSLLNNAGKGNQPPSVTITAYAGDQWRQLTTAQLDELTIKGNATGLVDYTCTWFANAASKLTPAPTPSFSTVQALPGWSFQAQLGASAPSPVEDWTFSFKRGVAPIPALTGSQEYLEYFAGPLDCAGKMTVIAQATEPELTAYEKGTQQSLDFTIFDIHEGFVLEIHSSRAQFLSGEITRGGEYVKVPLDVQLLPSATDATAGGKSPVTITVWNNTLTAI